MAYKALMSRPDSDCDTVACCYGISKGKVLLKTLRSEKALHRLGDPNEDLYLILYLKPHFYISMPWST